MYAKAKIKCSCQTSFEVTFDESHHDTPVKCPECGQKMDNDSWHTLRNIMGSLKCFNQHIHKYHLERQEPLMLAESVSSYSIDKRLLGL